MEPRKPGENESAPQPSFRPGSKVDHPRRKRVIFGGVDADAHLRADEGTAIGLPAPHRNEWSGRGSGETHPQTEPPDAPASGEAT